MASVIITLTERRGNGNAANTPTTKQEHMYNVVQHTVFMQGFTKEAKHKYMYDNDSPEL